MVPIDFRYMNTIYTRKIEQNLYAALVSLRRSRIDIALWVDAISIDQDNQEERAQQVRELTTIFSRAENVCVWLGSADEDLDNSVLRRSDHEISKLLP